MAGGDVALLDHLGLADANLFGFSSAVSSHTRSHVERFSSRTPPGRGASHLRRPHDEFAVQASAMVHDVPGWTDELRSLALITPFLDAS